MANTSGEKELRRNWPNTTGLDADSKHEGRQTNLVAELGSVYPTRKKTGL